MSDSDKAGKASNGAAGTDGPHSLGADGDHLVVSKSSFQIMTMGGEWP